VTVAKSLPWPSQRAIGITDRRTATSAPNAGSALPRRGGMRASGGDSEVGPRRLVYRSSPGTHSEPTAAPTHLNVARENGAPTRRDAQLVTRLHQQHLRRSEYRSTAHRSTSSASQRKLTARDPPHAKRRLRALASRRVMTTERKGGYEIPPTPIADRRSPNVGYRPRVARVGRIERRSSCSAAAFCLVGRFHVNQRDAGG
jgi:hypothetical protein